LTEAFPVVQRSTIVFIRRGGSLGRVSGELYFEHGYRIVIHERILYDRLPAVIDWYGYEIWRNVEKLYWYDSQPHPDELALQSSYPHHKHIPPDIKHNRIPAPAMSFIEPNLPVLIAEVEGLIQAHGTP
jgi:hypothetical protein